MNTTIKRSFMNLSIKRSILIKALPHRLVVADKAPTSIDFVHKRVRRELTERLGPPLIETADFTTDYELHPDAVWDTLWTPKRTQFTIYAATDEVLTFVALLR